MSNLPNPEGGNNNQNTQRDKATGLPTQAPAKQLTPAPIPGRPDITLPTYKDGERNNTLDQYRGIDTATPDNLATVPMPSSRNTQNE